MTEDNEADQRRDAMLLRALKTPAIPRAQLQEEMRRAREGKRSMAKPTPLRGRIESDRAPLGPLEKNGA
jgi:hypothetical protein